MRKSIVLLAAILSIIVVFGTFTAPAQTKSEPAYRLERVPNENILVIHLNRTVTENGVDSEHFSYGMYSGFSHKEDQSGDIGTQLVKQPSILMRKLLLTDGVDYVVIKKYEVSVGKGDAFEWDEVLPPVLQLIADRIAGGKPMKQLPSTDRWANSQTRDKSGFKEWSYRPFRITVPEL